MEYRFSNMVIRWISEDPAVDSRNPSLKHFSVAGHVASILGYVKRKTRG